MGQHVYSHKAQPPSITTITICGYRCSAFKFLVGRQFLPWNAKTAPPTQVLSTPTLVSSFRMVCHIFCSALYVRSAETNFFTFYKWGWHFGRLSSIKRFVRREQRSFCDQHTCKNLKFSHSAYSRFNQLNPVGTWAERCFMAMRLTEFKMFSF